MQDGYAGDVGDFGKYRLLNQLCGADGRGQTELTLGVLWYVPPSYCVNAAQNAKDGKYISYLEPEKGRRFRTCDPCLWEKMHRVVHGDRSIAAVERSGALPDGTKFYSEPQVCWSHRDRAATEERRCNWLQAGRSTVKGTDLVFFDPDNGFEIKSVKPHHKMGPKHVFYDDLDAHVGAGQSLVVYHHLSRNKRHVKQISERLKTVSERFDLGERAFALRFKRGTGRAYFVLPNPAHSGLLAERAQRLIDSLWGKAGHFDRCIYRP